MNGIFLNY